ncbi:MAG: hypothetical protein JJE30_11225 [Desulfuromonadales bacterium]|nr:hypothetical protein [Desulfuromonadales bacterium]
MEENERNNEISCLAKLDFKILCETQGKEEAIKIFRIINALKMDRMASKIEKPEPPSYPKPG